VHGTFTLGRYISELYLNQSAFSQSAGVGWTANMVVNSTQNTFRPGYELLGYMSGTALVTGNGSDTKWHAPLGGCVTTTTTTTTTTATTSAKEHGAGTITVGNISLGTAAVETWTITIDGDRVEWSVTRVM
jgi:hypothetical protein